MIGIKPVTEGEVGRVCHAQSDPTVRDIIWRLWEQNRDQAAYITQMQASIKEANKIIKQGKLF